MSNAPPPKGTLHLGTAIAAALASSCASADDGCVPTVADSLGPYYVAGTAITENLNRLGKPGESLIVSGSVLGYLWRWVRPPVTPRAGAVHEGPQE